MCFTHLEIQELFN